MLNLNEGIDSAYHKLIKEETDTSHENISETIEESEIKEDSEGNNRYAVYFDMYMWDKDDESVIKQAEEFCNKINKKYDAQCEINKIYYPNGFGNKPRVVKEKSDTINEDSEDRSPEAKAKAKEIAEEVKLYFKDADYRIKNGEGFGDAWYEFLEKVASAYDVTDLDSIDDIDVEPAKLLDLDSVLLDNIAGEKHKFYDIALEVYSYYFYEYLKDGGGDLLVKEIPKWDTSLIEFHNDDYQYEWESNTSNNNDPQYDTSGVLELPVSFEGMNITPEFNDDYSVMTLKLSPENEDDLNDSIKAQAEAHMEAQSEY